MSGAEESFMKRLAIDLSIIFCAVVIAGMFMMPIKWRNTL